MMNQTEALDFARNIGERFVREAIWLDDRCTWCGWVSLQTRGGSTLIYKSMDANLDQGTLGVALFLLELYRHTQDGSLVPCIQGAIAQASSLYKRGKFSERLGFFNGLAGLCYVMSQTSPLIATETPSLSQSELTDDLFNSIKRQGVATEETLSALTVLVHCTERSSELQKNQMPVLFALISDVGQQLIAAPWSPSDVKHENNAQLQLLLELAVLIETVQTNHTAPQLDSLVQQCSKRLQSFRKLICETSSSSASAASALLRLLRLRPDFLTPSEREELLLTWSRLIAAADSEASATQTPNSMLAWMHIAQTIRQEFAEVGNEHALAGFLKKESERSTVVSHNDPQNWVCGGELGLVSGLAGLGYLALRFATESRLRSLGQFDLDWRFREV